MAPTLLHRRLCVPMARGHCGTCRGTSWSGPRCKDRVRSPPGGVTWGRPGRVLGSFSRFWWTVFPASHPLLLSGVASGVKPQIAPQILRQGSCDHPTFSKGDHKTQRKGGPNSKNWDLRNSDCTRRRRDRSAHSLSSHSFFFAFFARASMLPALLSRSAALAASWHRVCRRSVAFPRDQMCHAVHRRVHGVHRRCTFVHHMLARLSR